MIFGHTKNCKIVAMNSLWVLAILLIGCCRVEAQLGSQPPISAPALSITNATTTITTTTTNKPTQQQGVQATWPTTSSQAPSTSKTPNILVIKASDLAPTTASGRQQRPSLAASLAPTTTTTTKQPHDQADSDSKLWPFPVVNVDRHENKSKVDVHVPIVFDMTKDDDPSAGKSKLDLSVLSGLVTVNKDQTKQPNGLLSGPLTVTVFGIPVYSGYATRLANLFGTINSRLSGLQSTRTQTQTQAPIQSARAVREQKPSTIVSSRIVPSGRSLDLNKESPLSNHIEKKSIIVNSSAADEPSTTRLYTDALRKTNRRVLNTLGDALDRVSTAVRQQAEPIENINGKPVDKSHQFVKPSTFSEYDLKPKKVTLPAFTLKKENVAHESHVYV